MTEEEREEKNRKRREYRKRIGNADSKKYEKTPKGFLMRLYRNMQSRINGIQKQKHHLYKGKTLLSREQFYEWALNHPEYWQLREIWVNSNYERRLTPSVDRVDSDKGYELSNMEWVTHSENSRRGSLSDKRKIR